MIEVTKDTFAPPKPSPVFAGMPEYLKDHANYEKIQKTIIETLAGNCSHGEVIEWATCPKCQRRFAEKGAIIRKLGFRSMAQYMAWQKTHQHIKDRIRLAKYDE